MACANSDSQAIMNEEKQKQLLTIFGFYIYIYIHFKAMSCTFGFVFIGPFPFLCHVLNSHQIKIFRLFCLLAFVLICKSQIMIISLNIILMQNQSLNHDFKFYCIIYYNLFYCYLLY